MAGWSQAYGLNAGKGDAVRVTIVRADGSTPREIGTGMTVRPGGFAGTIGGGTLEHEAMAHARSLLGAGLAPWHRETRDFPLGPALGQCCGGFVRLLFEHWGEGAAHTLPALEDETAVLARMLESGAAPHVVSDRRAVADLPLPVARVVRDGLAGVRPAAALIKVRGGPDWFVEPLARPQTPLFLYGAGHVGRAIVRVAEGLPFDLKWVDVAPSRFPDPVPPHAEVVVAAEPARIAAAAPGHAYHLVMTFSHALDLDVCHAVLAKGQFAYLGLIGSQTKKARFLSRLRELGMTEAQLARLHCPIGLGGIEGKEPAAIAVATAADLLRRLGAEAAAAPAEAASAAQEG